MEKFNRKLLKKQCVEQISLCYYCLMIGSIRGNVIWQDDKSIIVETGGVGYKVRTLPETIAKSENKELKLFIHTHVREDALDLYGFEDYADLNFFELLISISGIGPKAALSILCTASTDTLKNALSTGDVTYLTKISGIGKKTAEKMVLELKDKVTKNENEGSLREELEALEALKALGYSHADARDALKQITENLNTQNKIKEALKILSQK